MIVIRQLPRWLVALLLALLLGLAACGQSEAVDSAPTPEIDGPALVYFYTDG